MAQVPWLNPTTQTDTNTHTETDTHTHLLSPRVGSAAVPVGSLCDLAHRGQNKVYTIVGKIGASRRISMNENKCQIFNKIYSRYRRNYCICTSAVMLLEMSYTNDPMRCLKQGI